MTKIIFILKIFFILVITTGFILYSVWMWKEINKINLKTTKMITEQGVFWVENVPEKDENGCMIIKKNWEDYLYCGKYIIENE